MRRTIGRAVRPVVAVVLVAATTLAVGAANPGSVHAAPATFTKVPTRLYMIPKEHSTVVPDLLAGLFIPIETMKFADAPLGDVISAQSRVIEISAEEQSTCNVAADALPDFNIGGLHRGAAGGEPRHVEVRPTADQRGRPVVPELQPAVSRCTASEP